MLIWSCKINTNYLHDKKLNIIKLICFIHFIKAEIGLKTTNSTKKL